MEENILMAFFQVEIRRRRRKNDKLPMQFGPHLERNSRKKRKEILLANKTHAFFLKRRFKKPKNNC